MKDKIMAKTTKSSPKLIEKMEAAILDWWKCISHLIPQCVELRSLSLTEIEGRNHVEFADTLREYEKYKESILSLTPSVSMITDGILEGTASAWTTKMRAAVWEVDTVFQVLNQTFQEDGVMDAALFAACDDWKNEAEIFREIDEIIIPLRTLLVCCDPDARPKPAWMASANIANADKYMGVKDAAFEGKTSTKTIYRAITTGELKSSKVGGTRTWRIHRADFDSWMVGVKKTTKKKAKKA